MKRIDYNKENMDELAAQLRLGCEETRTLMIEGYIPLVHSKVEKWLQFYPGLEYLEDDMISEGYLAVVKAINAIREGEYPERSNVTAYVSVAIVNTIGEFLDNNDMIRVPRSSDEDTLPVHQMFDWSVKQEDARLLDTWELLEKSCLTNTERQLVDLLTKGYTEREVAVQLGISQNSVNLLKWEIHERYTRLEQG